MADWHETKRMWVDRLWTHVVTFNVHLTHDLELGFPRTLDFQGQILKKSYLRKGMSDWHGMKGVWVDRMLNPCCDFQRTPHHDLDLGFSRSNFEIAVYLRIGRVDSLGMKRMWVGYDVGCTMGLTLDHGAWQIDWPSSGSTWKSYSFQPVGQWMGYSFTDLGAEGCCRSLNALFKMSLKNTLVKILPHLQRSLMKIASVLTCLLFCLVCLSCVTVQDIKSLNSLRPADTSVNRHHKSGSTLNQIMICCQTAPRHYLNQCCLIISWGFMIFTWEQFHSECSSYYSV